METQPRIKVKSLAWIEKDHRLYVVEMTDKIKHNVYYRPVGGSVEFGERAVDAVRRELREELATTVEVMGDPLILENLFTCDGEPGHEIVYLFPCRFMDPHFYELKTVPLTEADGSQWQAMWITVEDCLNGTLRLVPEALLNWYKNRLEK